MKRFFSNIDEQKPVNYTHYIEKFKTMGIEIELLFLTKIKRYPYYYLTPKDQTAYKLLKSRFDLTVESTDRLSATILGNSHNQNVTYSFLLIREHIDSLVSTLFFEQSTLKESNIKVFKKKVVIIENLENFGNIFSNFKHIDVNLNEYSFIYGAGNAVNNKSFVDFFQKFDRILCLFDIDEAGLSMFNTFSKAHEKAEFIFPSNIDTLAGLCASPQLNNEDIFRINALYENNQKLHNVLDVMNRTKKNIEQEIYLKEDN